MNHSTFLSNLLEVNSSLYALFDLCREKELAPYAENGCMLYDEELGKTCFQVSGQFERPREFIDTLLDMMRVTYEPTFFGTFFLNANPAFIYDAIPKKPFTVGYLSVLGNSGQPFGAFWQNEIAAKLSECRYDLRQCSSTFVVVAASLKRMTMELVDEILEVTGSGFSQDEALGLLAAGLDLDLTEPKKDCHAGFVLDDGLEDRLRVSIWMFLEERTKARSLKVVRAT